MSVVPEPIPADFALYNVDHLVTMAPGAHPAAEGELGVITCGALAARDGKIVWVGTMDEMAHHVLVPPDATIVNTHGRTVLPGFVDAHTHPVFMGDRLGDFYARSIGSATYAEQLEMGGLMQTVRATRAASEDELLTRAFQRTETFLRHGTTTIGAKTGYGLTLRDELKSLRVLMRLQRLQSLKVVPAFLPAHVLPEDYHGSADEYVAEIVDSWLPAAAGQAVFVDVWCEDGVFNDVQCRAILARAKELGFALTGHANELVSGPGVRLLAEMGAASVDHAVYLDERDIDALAASDTVAVLLPGTTFFLDGAQYAPARALLDAGVTVALSTDFNPGTSPTQNMEFILTLAVSRLGMTAEEALRAATVNGARALGLAGAIGSLEVGKYCDLAVYHTADYRSIPYHYAMNLVDTVVAGGQVVVCDGEVRDVPAHALAT